MKIRNIDTINLRKVTASWYKSRRTSLMIELFLTTTCFFSSCRNFYVGAFVPEINQKVRLPRDARYIATTPPERIQQRQNSLQLRGTQEAISDLAEVDVLYGYRTQLVYDPKLERYVPISQDHVSLPNNINGEGAADENYDASSSHFAHRITSHFAKTPPGRLARRVKSRIMPTLKASFLPEGVSPSYYTFVRWRILQRFVNANVHVFGTQSLLLGLGLKSRSLGLSAALNWVLKDALGKVTRMATASKMGRKFDSDAKRWRFRSSLMFALGNFLEIVTYIFPQLFLLWATVANCCKQVSMLTSSSTRTALYNSFRDGTRENIGDIIAKGEAQIAVVDLLGIASGVSLSRAVGTSVRSVLAVYFCLQVIEIFCMYHEIRAVQFRVMNFERLQKVVNVFVNQYFGDYEIDSCILQTPKEMAQDEKIFLPPRHLERRAIAFGSLSRAKLAPDELQDLLKIFKNEKYMIVVGADVKNHPRRRASKAEENCHIVLHKDAGNSDIVKTVLALSLLRKKLSKMKNPPTRSRDCMDMIAETKKEADLLFPVLLNAMARHGWAPPSRFMFGRVTMRADWPLSKRSDEKSKAKESDPTKTEPTKTETKKAEKDTDKRMEQQDVP